MLQFSNQLKKLRTECELSQEELANQLFISRQAISKWENGEAAPDMNNLIKLADIFEVSLDKLVLGKEDEKVVENAVEKKTEKHMNGWEFLVNYWWLLFPLGGLVLWFLRGIAEILH
ncbi:helix-turn-helix domain-containing protein [Streptococcus ratti]|uniref:Transcriptional regulator n=1 Tax=Streptococcus ratti FA-1 = DSM 20564 TaxID=699248 RepID=A0ABN0GW98_STRRT|nr:helix-turn-helix transcriptional regulator [Streptococcus ratti]EJN94776.1 transcriptional regulator [Streptococcus ratti FA-1 = DSM 20564]EMP69986.1 putative transcriptional regulator [Streptococcus ratti FA-1 = DSM 20564]QEY06689.1 helix-turn-helix transcriptional regulator [Streptococcus ratti]VEI59092.1 DNA-binding protein [Streptococcus mutans]